MPLVRNFHVECPTPDPKKDWEDHTCICVPVDAAAISQTSSGPIARQLEPIPDFSGNEEVDVLYQATMDARKTPEQALNSLYGSVLSESSPVHVYAEGAAHQEKPQIDN